MKKTLFLSFILSLLLAQPAFSHAYHYELEVSNTLQTNDKNQLEALKLSWLYDGDVSEVMLQDNKDLKTLAKSLIADLEKLGYFTQAKIDGKVLAFTTAKDVTLEKKNNGKYDTLLLSFTLPFKSPATLKGNPKISFFHEDPSAAAILYYKDTNSLKFSNALSSHCKASVAEKENFKEGEFPQIANIKCSNLK